MINVRIESFSSISMANKKRVSKKAKTKTNKNKKCKKKSCPARRQIPLLQTLKELKPTHRSIMLGHMNDESCEAIYKAVRNVLQSNKIGTKEKKNLRSKLLPYKNEVRALSNDKKSRKSKRKTLLQLGGFPLSTILSVAIPLLLQAIKK